MKYIKLFEDFDPYEYMIMSPNNKTKLIIDEIKKRETKDANLDYVKNLIELGANLEYIDDVFGETVLHIACRFETKTDLVKMLLDYGMDPNIEDEAGFTPIFSVAENNKGIDIAKTLIDNGANVKTIKSKFNGATPLHLAAEYANLPITELFLVEGINPNAQDDEGNTPLHYALERESDDTVQLLLDFGADPTIKNAGNLSPFDLSKDLWTPAIFNLFQDHISDINNS
jgi:ankyrin repeat protein